MRFNIVSSIEGKFGYIAFNYSGGSNMPFLTGAKGLACSFESVEKASDIALDLNLEDFEIVENCRVVETDCPAMFVIGDM